LLDNPKNIDEICSKLKENVATITSKLTMMQIDGIIEQLPGNKFKVL